MANTDYVLGTDADEVIRLGRQHAVWRSIASDGWQRAGIGTGSRVIDVGAGPGFATRDLLERVGPTGFVHAVERSDRFASVLRDDLSAQSVTNVAIRGGNPDDYSTRTSLSVNGLANGPFWFRC